MHTPYTPFWMVYGAGKGAPTARHKNRTSALTEAKRLARVYPETPFFVLEATHHVVKRDVDVSLIDPDFADVDRSTDDDMPF